MSPWFMKAFFKTPATHASAVTLQLLQITLFLQVEWIRHSIGNEFTKWCPSKRFTSYYRRHDLQVTMFKVRISDRHKIARDEPQSNACKDVAGNLDSKLVFLKHRNGRVHEFPDEARQCVQGTS
ncbi:hypothetical protein CC2G_011708 [Coprinopsis cinerea AmutBmut pab1-1]|nr:hypothetical protein CC2G_011708 [Coprinopsis cinerea AmutBmut pab1-1]